MSPPILVGAAWQIGRKLLQRGMKKEAGRIAARGGAVSGPPSRLPGGFNAGPGGAVAGGGQIIKRAGRAVAIGAGVGIAADKLLGGGQKRRYRRMQVTNMRALDRALRRLDGFQKRVKKAFSISGDMKPRKRRGCR